MASSNVSWEQDSDAVFEAETAGVRDPMSEPEYIRPEKEKYEANAFDDLLTPEMVGGILAIPGNMQAKRTGHDFWKLEPEEQELLGKTCQPVVIHLLNKWMSQESGLYGVALVGLAGVYLPRLMIELEEQRKEKKQPPKSPRAPNQQSHTTSEQPDTNASSSVSQDVESQPSSSASPVLPIDV